MSDYTGLYGSSSPHDHAAHTTSSIMRDVAFALMPILIFATLYFGWKALLLTVISVASSVFWEWLFEKLLKKPITITDFSAVVTGILLAFNLPVSAPWWLPVIGTAFAILLVKQLFGGIGKNFMNPALAARCFLLVSFPTIMMTFPVDGMTAATPLAYLKTGALDQAPGYVSCFLGVINGSFGETSKILILLGGMYLIVRKVIDWRIPVGFLGTVFILSYLFGGDGLYQILTGGVMLGAFFMATDYSTSPMNQAGRLIYGIGCGLMTVIIRFFGSYPEGASFSILFMNVVTPLIDRYTVRRVYGTGKQHLFKSAKNAKEGEKP